MRLRTACRVGGATLAALGLVLAGRFSTHLGVGGHPAAGGHHLSSSAFSSHTVRTSHVEAAPSGAPPSASDAKLTANAKPNGDTGGVLIIRVPPAAPELCSQVPITVNVGQTAVAACRSANYDGPIIASLSNPAIASVTTSGGLMLPRYLYIVGRQAGATIVRVSYPGGPTTSYPIVVHPAGTSGG